MYFNINTGKKFERGSYKNHIITWWADPYIFFSNGAGMYSIILKGNKVEQFCDLLAHACTTQDYVELKKERGLYIALEEEDERTRNLCLYDKSVQIILNVQTKYLNQLANFYREQI